MVMVKSLSNLNRLGKLADAVSSLLMQSRFASFHINAHRESAEQPSSNFN
jgi:hypothetical protein